MDLGRSRNLTCYIIYGKSGGSKEAKRTTAAIIEAITEEMKTDHYLPTIIMGDFRCEPGELAPAEDLIENDVWIDVGAKASWWGGTENETTCQTRPQAKPSRIDGVLANSEAVPLIKSYEVIKDEMISTHSVVRLKLHRAEEKEERSFLKTLPSLERLYEEKVKERTNDLQGKEKTEKEKEQRNLLHKHIEDQLDKHKADFEIHEELKDTSSFWKLWSKVVERGWLNFLDESKVFDIKAKGRGNVDVKKNQEKSKGAQSGDEAKGWRAGKGGRSDQAGQKMRAACLQNSVDQRQGRRPRQEGTLLRAQRPGDKRHQEIQQRR